MNATTSSPGSARKSYLSKKRVALLVIGAFICLGLTRQAEPVFNDVNYANLFGGLDKTVSLPDGSPEQAVAYVTLGKHLDKGVYGNWTAMDVVHWMRDPGNPLRPLLRRHPELKNDWEVKAEDGISNADHYRGFAAGPLASARILFQESAPEHLEALNALLARHAGTDPESLDLDAQEVLLHKVLVEDPEGRRMIQDLTSRRLLCAQARGYRTLTQVVGTPGLAMRWTQRNWLWLLGGLALFCGCRRALRQRERNHCDKQFGPAHKPCAGSIQSRAAFHEFGPALGRSTSNRRRASSSTKRESVAFMMRGFRNGRRMPETNIYHNLERRP
jgi:hypothetical protein